MISINKQYFLLRLGVIFALVVLVLPGKGHAQYFGRNKPSYETFEFQVYETPHFDIYHYFENDSIQNWIAHTYEKWYKRHQELFRDTFETQNPVLMYANHPDFQQTTAISGMIGVGTMGVTESLRNRVVMPILETNAQTDHVIGHELVHAFHYRAMFKDDSLSMNSMQNLPLWLVEGMAEYFSLGSLDSHTAMIMRDAIHQDNFPTLEEMSQGNDYNPYRFGQAFVSFFGRTWGDSLIVPFFKETAKFGYSRALERVVGLSERGVNRFWREAYESHYEPLAGGEERHTPVGETLISYDNAGGKINISPAFSPDGESVAFFSEKALLSIDLYLADASTGEIKHTLASGTRSGDIDGYNFFESRGTWSPDGKQFAHVAIKKGVNQLVIVETDRPRQSREFRIPGVPSFNNPTWSPDGSYIVFNGLVDGRSDLYRFDLETKEVTQLTDDRYSYAHAAFSSDGRYLAFSTDRPQTAQQGEERVNMHNNLGVMDLENDSRSIAVLDVFPGAENLNPVFSPDGGGIYFLSNSDGFRNLYFYSLDNGDLFRMTDYYTGISGITQMTPAFSIARETGDIVYSHYKEGNYSIYRASPDEFQREQVDPMDVDMTASVLPPFRAQADLIIDKNLEVAPYKEIFPVDSFAEKPFDPRFSLSYIGSTGIGMATSRYGTGMAGGVAMMFTDITGDNQLFAQVAVNGEIYDFGGMVGYLNQKSRVNWGATASHIPYSFASLRMVRDTLQFGDDVIQVDNLQLLQQRTFQDQLALYAYYPFSTTRRLEAGGSMALYYFRIDAINNYYHQGFRVGEDRERLTNLEPSSFFLSRLNMAYVGDNSFFGMASPMAGWRYRFGVEKMFGRVDLYNLTADYRHYYRVQPFTFAIRGIHYGRYGREPENDLFYPQYLGYPGYVRGYDYSTLNQIEQTFGSTEEDQAFNKLLGSRVLLGGLEVRMPFTGPEELALISSGFFFTELAWFLDAGVAWSSDSNITLDPSEASEPGKRFPVFSTGPSLRINLFGAIILEPYLAFPFHTSGIQESVWGLNFLPGW
ncbi:MAG: hypothetical protein ACLFN2_01125 [Bacteroidales bacterium]